MPRAATTKPYKPRAPKVEAEKPAVPKMADVQNHEWMDWVEYAQSRIRYLENKLSIAQETIDDQKANIARMSKRLLQG
jgi:hypothetical protein